MNFEAIKKAAQDYRPAMAKFLRDMIAIPSESCQEEGVVRRIAQEMESLGYDKVEFDKLGNVIGWMGTGDKIIALDSHIDTVGIGNIENWEADPYQGYETDEVIYGRGGSDQEGGMAAATYGAKIMKDLDLIPQGYRIMVVGSVQEEDCDGMCWQYIVNKYFSSKEEAQEKIEFNNFGIRKNLLDYDQVNNEQREIIYKERRQVLDGENMREAIYKMIQDTVDTYVDMCFSDDVDSEEWDLNEFNGVLTPIIPIRPLTAESVKGKKRDEIRHELKEEAVKLYEEKEAEFPEPEQLRELERVVLLKCIDSKWMDHIDDMEILRQGIGLAAYGQRDPVVEYKMSAFDMFNEMITSIQEDTLRMLYHVHVEQKIEREQVAKVTGTNKDDSAGPKKPVQRKEIKVYPNDPCPCGSGKKYKQCCGRKNKV